MPQWCNWTPSQPNLQAWFCNPVIRGHIGHLLDKGSGKGWKRRWAEIHYDQHPALINEADWQELAELLQRTHNPFAGPGAPTHGLTGLLRCASCGSTLRRNTSGETAWWRCRHRLCQERAGIREQVALREVVAACVAAADRLAAVAAEPAAEDPMVAAKLRDLKELQQLAARNASIRPACEALRAEIEALRQRPAASPDGLLIAERLRDPGFFEGATAEEQRALFGAVLVALEVARSGEVRAQPRGI